MRTVRCIGILDPEQLRGDAVELGARRKARPGGGVAFDLAERMERASLNLGVGPHSLPCLLEPAAGAGHVGHAPLREQPAWELVEPLGLVVDPVHGRGPAGRAFPSLGSRGRLSVADHPLAANRVFRDRHGRSLFSINYFV